MNELKQECAIAIPYEIIEKLRQLKTITKESIVEQVVNALETYIKEAEEFLIQDDFDGSYDFGMQK